jgi:hypothetical protein
MLDSDTAPAATGEWECMECGYVEPGTANRRPAKCPECDAASDALEFFSDDDEEEDWDESLDGEDPEDESDSSDESDESEEEYDDEDPETDDEDPDER